MHFQISTLLPAVLFAVSLGSDTVEAKTRINKPQLFKDHWKDFAPLTEKYPGVTKEVPHEITAWQKNHLPEHCAKEAAGKCSSVKEVTAYSVTLEDVCFTHSLF